MPYKQLLVFCGATQRKTVDFSLNGAKLYLLATNMPDFCRKMRQIQKFHKYHDLNTNERTGGHEKLSLSQLLSSARSLNTHAGNQPARVCQSAGHPDPSGTLHVAARLYRGAGEGTSISQYRGAPEPVLCTQRLGPRSLR